MNDGNGNLRAGTLKRELLTRERRFGVEVGLPLELRQPLGGVGSQDAHLRNLLKLPGFKDDRKFRQLLVLELYELVLEDFSRRRVETTQDLVLACRELDRAMHAVFGRDVDLLVDVADHITENAGWWTWRTTSPRTRKGRTLA